MRCNKHDLPATRLPANPERPILLPHRAADEKAQIDSWLAANGKNKYGDDPGTMYAVRTGDKRWSVAIHGLCTHRRMCTRLRARVQGGNPAFNMATGVMTDRHEYVVSKFPHRPWRSGSAGTPTPSAASGNGGTA
jgi:hypothetical protein